MVFVCEVCSRLRGAGVDFAFKILTAFIRLGRARRVAAGCPPYYNIILWATARVAPTPIPVSTVFTVVRCHRL